MKILRVKFDNIIIFNEPFDIDFTAPDRIMESSGVYKVWSAINTQQTISIIGINAAGKTTSLRLLNLAMEVVLNKKGACLIFTTHYAEILDSFDRMDNIYILVRTKNHFTKVHRYSEMVKRSELKKSEVILSNYIKGTAPKASNIKSLEEYICNMI